MKLNFDELHEEIAELDKIISEARKSTSAIRREEVSALNERRAIANLLRDEADRIDPPAKVIQ